MGRHHHYAILVDGTLMCKCGGKTADQIQKWMEDPKFDPVQLPMALIPRVPKRSLNEIASSMRFPLKIHGRTVGIFTVSNPSKITFIHIVRTRSTRKVTGKTDFIYDGKPFGVGKLLDRIDYDLAEIQLNTYQAIQQTVN